MGRLIGIRKLLAALAATMVAVIASAQAGKLTVELEPAFTDLKLPGRSQTIVPVRVTLRNSGADAAGMLVVSSGNYRMTYPVDLPSGSVKRFVAYTLIAEYGDRSEFSLQTDRGSAVQHFEVPIEESAFLPILLASDTPGLMVFMRGAPQSKAGNGIAWPRDTYARPGELPDRACGYWAVRAVVLGEGAERLTNPEVGALKTWVTAGGTLVMLGGASSPVLSDPRWAEYAPIRNAVAMTMPASSVLAKLGRSSVPAAPMAVLKGEVPSGCTAIRDGGVPIVVSRPIGLGKVVFFAFNPFEEPLKRWQGRPRLLASQTAPSFGGTAFDLISQGRQDDYGPQPFDPGMEDDPFTVRLPDVATVAWILIGYLVLVVPINLIVLRKLNRSEWAWVTTPAISLVFAAIFFGFAGNLYSAKLSVSTGGALVLDSRFDTAYFVGSSQLFFPRGGVYDLALEGTEAVVSGGFHDYYRYSDGRTTDLNAVDGGDVKVDSLRTGNLSFIQMDYVQRVRASKWLDANLALSRPDPSGPMIASGSVTNRSPYAITGTLICGSHAGVLPRLPPGATIKIDGLAMRKRNGPSPRRQGSPGRSTYLLASSTVDTNAGSPARVLIDGYIEGFHPGPQIGEFVNRGEGIRVLAVLGEVEVPRP